MAVYIRYEVENLEPLRIADDSSSHMGQTSTLHYIPGTTMRGMVVNKLSRKENFSELKGRLFSDRIRFLNAYPIVERGEEKIELIPSPKGFYEDKAKEKVKKLENVLKKGDFPEGYKRASVGEFAYLEKNPKSNGLVLRYMRIPTGSDLKIKINLEENETQTVFRNEYIAAGNKFAGYIAVEDEGDISLVKEALSGNLILGNARTSGLGKCSLANLTVTTTEPFENYVADDKVADSCYMMLLSHTVMRDQTTGEYCGIDEKQLGAALGIEDGSLVIDSRATSVVDVRGYNRKWGVRIPSVRMYEKGSVFKLKFNGEIGRDQMLSAMNKGIGVRRNEGFGRILFLKDYEEIMYRMDMAAKYDEPSDPDHLGIEAVKNPDLRAASDTSAPLTAKQDYDCFDYEKGASAPDGCTMEEFNTLRAVAKNYYRNLFHAGLERYVVDLNWNRGKVSSSKLAKVEAFTTAFRFDYTEAKANIEKFFEHARERQIKERVQFHSHSDISDLDNYVTDILSWDLGDLEEALDIHTKKADRIMGIPKLITGEKDGVFTEEEIGRMKLELLTKVIRFDHKKGD